MSGLGVPCEKAGKYCGRSIACIGARRRWEVVEWIDRRNLISSPWDPHDFFSLALGAKRQPVLRIHTIGLPYVRVCEAQSAHSARGSNQF